MPTAPSSDSDAELTFVRETAAIVPDPGTYEFVGYVQPRVGIPWIHEDAPEESVAKLLSKHGTYRSDARDDEEASDSGRGLLLSADGRLFIERDSLFRARLEAEGGEGDHGRTHYAVRDEDRAAESEFHDAPCRDPERPDEVVDLHLANGARAVPAVGPTHEVLVSDDRPTADTFHGGDGRSLVTSSAYPWSAVGVALLRRTSPAGQSSASYSRSTSGTMIGPRHVLTAAHVFTDGNGVDNVLGAAPAARGYNYANDQSPYTECGFTPKFPFGIRRVQWYYWPAQWDDSGLKFDYAVLILRDNCPVLPGYIGWGYQTAHWLNYRYMNMAGYPAAWKKCEASPEGNGDCDGYMYYQYEQTTAVYTNYAYSRFDVQEGQSGAGIYDRSGSDRHVYIIHKGSSGPYTYGKRLRSGSFSTICSWVDNWTSQYGPNPNC